MPSSPVPQLGAELGVANAAQHFRLQTPFWLPRALVAIDKNTGPWRGHYLRPICVLVLVCSVLSIALFNSSLAPYSDSMHMSPAVRQYSEGEPVVCHYDTGEHFRVSNYSRGFALPRGAPGHYIYSQSAHVHGSLEFVGMSGHPDSEDIDLAHGRSPFAMLHVDVLESECPVNVCLMKNSDGEYGVVIRDYTSFGRTRFRSGRASLHTGKAEDLWARAKNSKHDALAIAAGWRRVREASTLTPVLFKLANMVARLTES